MPTASKRATKRLTDAKLQEVLALTSHADSVELKLTVPDSDRSATVTGLGMDPLEAQIRQVFFFDTPDLRLNKRGVVVRARRVQGRGDDSVVKLRPIVPERAAPQRPQRQDHGGRGRRHARRLCLLGLVQGRHRPRRRRQAGRGRRPGHPQAVLQAAAGLLRGPRPRRPGNGRPVGPGADQRPQAQVHPQGLRPADGGRAVAVPRRGADPGAVDQVRRPARRLQVAAEARVFLADRGVDLYGEQQTKTKTALEYFAKNLQGAAS